MTAKHENCERYERLVEYLRAGVVVHAADTQILSANPFACALLGLSLDQMRGKSAIDPAWSFLRDDGTRMPVDEYPVRRVIDTGRPVENLVAGIASFGAPAEAWVLVNAFPERNASGTIEQVVVTFVDITASRRSEESLRESERKYRNLHESMMDAFVSVDMSGRLQEFNRAYQEMLGYSQDELRSLRYQDLTPPAWHDLEAEIVREQILPRGYSDIYEKEYRRKDGSVFPVEVRTSLIRGRAGEPQGMWAIVRDISKRCQAERALQLSELRFRTVAEAVADVVYEWDLRQEIAWLGDIDSLMGFGPKAFPRTFDGWSALVHPADRPGVLEAIERHLRGEAPYAAEYRVRRGDGSWGFWRSRGSASRDSAGKPVRWYGAITDITEKKRAGEELRKSEEDFRYIFENSMVGTSIMHPTGEVRVNGSLARMLGYVKEEMDGVLWQGVTHPADVAATREIANSLLAGEKEAARFTKRYLRKDGSVIWADVSTSLRRDDSGVPLYFMTNVIDITDRKRSEEALRESERLLRIAADAANLGVFARDLETGKVRVDERMRELYVLPQGEFRFEELLSRVHPEDIERFKNSVARATDPGAPDERVSIEYRIVRPGGEIRWVSAFIRFVFEGEGPSRHAVSSVGTTQDITERKRAEDSVVRAQRLEALGTLAGGIAHDFNNILLAILGNAAIAAYDLAADHPARLCIDEIKKASKRGAALVNQVLAFARPHSRKRTVLPFGPIVEDARTFLRAAVSTLIDITARVEDPSPEAAVDAGQVHQAIVNLVTNAADAIGPHPGCIRIAVEMHIVDDADVHGTAGLPPGRYARLSVSDDGPGMDNATLRRVFDPFFTTKTPEKGTGLGLSVVHGIMKSHDGAVSIESQPGRGTAVHLWFPAAAYRAEAARKEGENARSVRCERLLFIDDDEALVFLARRMLGRLGYQVTAFTDPSLALSEFLKRPRDFDGVITDLSMPKMSGFDLTSEILRARPDVPIVITSGYVRPEDEEIARAIGAFAVILKPDTVDGIAAVLDTIFTPSDKTRV